MTCTINRKTAKVDACVAATMLSWPKPYLASDSIESLQIGGVLNSSRFRDFVIAHRIYPLVLRNLSHLGRGSIEVHHRQLAGVLYKVLLRDWCPTFAILRDTYIATRAIFESLSQPFTILRGLHLASLYYEEPHDRVFGDIDILCMDKPNMVTLSAFADAGFLPLRLADFRAAQEKYVCQIELRHRMTGVRLDINWKLTGNGQNGGLSFDTTKVWERAQGKSAVEYELSPTDTLLDVARHIAQGHEYDGYTVQACADICRIMIRDGERIDWDYFESQVRLAKFERAAAFFLDYYDRNYALNERMPRFSERFLGFRNFGVPLYERRYMRHLITVQSWNFRRRSNSVGRLFIANVCLIVKYFSTTNGADLVRLGRITVIWPPSGIVILLDDEAFTGALYMKRMRVYVMLCTYLFPGLVFGVSTRLVCMILSLLHPRNRRKQAFLMGKIESGLARSECGEKEKMV